MQNVIYRNGDGEIVKNPSRPFITDLDVLPPVDYEMVDVSKYSIPTMAGRYVISMMLSRGCPFRCIFCVWPQIMYEGNLYNTRNPIDVIDEVEYCVKKWGFKSMPEPGTPHMSTAFRTGVASSNTSGSR